MTRWVIPVLFGFGCVVIVRGQGFPVETAASRMTIPKGFQVTLVAGEPDIRQPVAIDFDERGRLWVMQYLQYPNPAGLKRVSVDRYSRTVYDRIPDPPPRGPRGADRLTIVEPDPDRPGRVRTKDFVNGLNLASGFAFGHGGVFVLQAPYLLFYPDRNRDDVPDSDPVVCVRGFGMEDAHSVANSLTWGPDGWLYGCQGSTVTARIRGIEFQQGVWRYHPLTRKFELFCEGGGNSWGLDFDRDGRLLYSTNHGGYAHLHGVPGGYYWKSFGKHGSLHHPFAYGYFDHVPHTGLRGGHVTVGGLIYQADQFPPEYRNRYVGADLLGHAIRHHRLDRNGSTFRAEHLGELVQANDTWFAPSDLCQGPDGCLYVADWHEARTAHPDPDAEWDRRNGRVFRISYGDPPRTAIPDFGVMKSAELVRMVGDRNEWVARTCRRILADRRDSELILPLRRLSDSPETTDPLPLLWTLHQLGGVEPTMLIRMLGHRDWRIRNWAVRTFAEMDERPQDVLRELVAAADREDDVRVRSEWACATRRLPASTALPILKSLGARNEDIRDPHMPLLIWWGVERFAVSNVDQVTADWKSADTPIARGVVVPRLIRRLTAEGTERADQAVRELWEARPGDPVLSVAIEDGWRERSSARSVTPRFSRWVTQASGKRPDDPVLSRMAARLGDAAAVERLKVWANDPKHPAPARVAAVTALGEISGNGIEISAILIGLLRTPVPVEVQAAAVSAWSGVGTPAEGEHLIARYSSLSSAVQSRIRAVMFSRADRAKLLLEAVDRKLVPATDVAVAELSGIAAFRNEPLNALVRKHWGNVRGATPEEKLADVRRFQNDLRAGTGDLTRGHALFTKHCAACHQLFGQGGKLGPDLTHANRGDRNYLLVSLVDPNVVIRKEYASVVIETVDGRIITGLPTAQDEGSITVANAKGETTSVARRQIAAIRESAVSLMPEGLLHPLRPQELRDLFAFLQSTVPKK